MVFSKHAILSLLTGSLVLAYTLNPTAADTDDLCNNFAVHGGTQITFATNDIHGGNVGISPGTAITGGYTMDDGASVSIGDDGDLKFVDATVSDALAEALATTGGWATQPELGGKTFTPGIYKATGSKTFNIEANTNVTLNGEGSYLFQAETTMLTGAMVKIVLTGGAKAEDVVWALGTTFTTGADNVFQGSILAGTSVTIGARTTFYGDIFTEEAVTLGADIPLYGCVVALTAITFGTGTFVGAAPAPSQQVAEEYSSCNMCEGYAAYGGTAITFGARNKVSKGSVGGAPDIPITGSYVDDDDKLYESPLTSKTVLNAEYFAETVDSAFTEAWTQAGGVATPPEIGGKTFTPGIYKASGSGTFNVPASMAVTLNGEGSYIFQAASTMTTGASVKILLTGGAKAEDVIWALGTTFTAGADNDFEGSIRAGSVITVGANSNIHGSVFAGTEVSFGADVTLSGCAIALGPVTFGADNYISSAEEPSYCQSGMTETIPEDVEASIVAPSCDTDVLMVRKVGYSSYTDVPITIISQGSPTGEVTFKISQKWTTENNLSNLIVRFQDEYLTIPKCHAFDDVNATWTNEFTAICTKKSEIALVEVWASDNSFSEVSDNASPPDCSCETAITTDLPMVKYLFQVECVSTCTGSEDCDTSGRMLGSLGSEL
jgi:hypothetical protein